MKYQKFLSFFLILIIVYLSANAQDDIPPNAKPGMCYAQFFQSAKYSEEIKQIFEYTGTDYKAKGVKREVVEISPAITKWGKRKLDPNCESAYPEDCMVRRKVKVPSKSETYYVITDSSINKQFKITEIPISKLERAASSRSGWVQMLCKKDMNAKIIKNVKWRLVELGYLNENSLKDASTFGKKTKNAIHDYQIANDLPVGGDLNIPLLEHLGLH